MSNSSVIILLANEMDASGRLNQESKDRADLAAWLFRENEAKLMVPCGWDYREDSDLPIAAALSEYLISEHSFTDNDLHLEIRSRDTVGDAVFTKEYFAREALPEELIVVTSDYHTRRTRAIFEYVYGDDIRFDVQGAPSSKRESALSAEMASHDAFLRTFAGIPSGQLSSIYSRMAESHPFYNGVVHPGIGQL